METLIQKVEQMAATLLEAMNVEQGNSDTGSDLQEDERLSDYELDTEAHHSLIEPCW
jgi:hypothetical protein